MHKISFKFTVCLLLVVLCILTVSPALVNAAGTTSLTITKYANNGTTILDQITVDYQTLEAILSVQGDGVTRQYLQGPVFEGDIWDPGETNNIKDWGANKGTDLMDLCDLVGGMLPGDTVEVKASDGLYRTYDYPNVYTPDPRQGKIVICWWCDGQYVPQWADGMRLVFFAQTQTAGKYIFGNWDQHECFAQNRWYFYNGEYPTTTGHSVKYINSINIFSASPSQYTLTMNMEGEGTIAPAEGSHGYASGTVVNLTATPDDGWTFQGWTGGVSNPNLAATTVTMDSDKTIAAIFSQEIQYDLTLAVSGSGTVIPQAGVHSYDEGSIITITANAAQGWQFAEWTGDVASPTSATTLVTMDEDQTVTASFFEPGDSYEISMAISGEGMVTPAEGLHNYAKGSVVIITAKPAQGWRFQGWSGAVADPDAASTTVTMSKDLQISALFMRLSSCSLTLNASGNGSVNPASGIYDYDQGTKVEISATPNKGWQFARWNGDVANPQSPTTSITMDADKAVTAVFIEAAPQVSMAASNDDNKGASGDTNMHTYFMAALLAGALLVIVLIVILLARNRK